MLKRVEGNLQVDELKAAFRVAPQFLINNKFTSKVWMYAFIHFEESDFYVQLKNAIRGRCFCTDWSRKRSSIALLTHKRIIFVRGATRWTCSSEIGNIKWEKIAFAFNCASAGDIRLHYSSAKESIRDYRPGGIRKVDNAVGDNVELMICDIKSALVASYYMCAFNSKEDLLLYWDEPTISLDVGSHPLHEHIQQLWHDHPIPNVVLSSATLPSSVDMSPMHRVML